jgi:hypothetical protein
MNIFMYIPFSANKRHTKNRICSKLSMNAASVISHLRLSFGQGSFVLLIRENKATGIIPYNHNIFFEEPFKLLTL